MIEIVVNKRKATARQSEILTSGSVGISVSFIFSPEWEGLSRTAVFSNGSVTRDVVLYGSDCIIPHECLATSGKTLTVGVYGTNGETIVIPTVYCTLGRVLQGADPSGDPSIPPTPTVVQQIMSAASNAVNVAQSVRNDADAGAFDGATGPQGPQGERGPKGDKGDAGSLGSVTASVDSGSGTPSVDVTYDGTNANFVFHNLKGNTGATGATGAAGADGADGEDGVGIASISKTGTAGKVDTYTITLTNGTTKTFTVTNGTDGQNGAPGTPGQDGQDGTDGITPTIGTNGNWYLGETDTGKPSRGEQGQQGIQGIPGTPGADGQDGLTTSITVNGETITQSGGNIDIGTVLRSHQSLSAYRTATAQDVIDATKADKPTIKTAMDAVATVNTMYFLGAQSAVSIVLPSNANAGDQLSIVWYNGATAATLSVTGTVLTVDYTPSANSRSEVNALWDGTYWAVVTNEQAVTA